VTTLLSRPRPCLSDLPRSLNLLRPFVLTAEVGTRTPGQATWGGDQFARTLNWGFIVQYSLPYCNSHIGNIGGNFIKHLIPTVERFFSTPTANAAPAFGEECEAAAIVVEKP
jgi:hypothetical protein